MPEVRLSNKYSVVYREDHTTGAYVFKPNVVECLLKKLGKGATHEVPKPVFDATDVFYAYVDPSNIEEGETKVKIECSGVEEGGEDVFAPIISSDNEEMAKRVADYLMECADTKGGRKSRKSKKTRKSRKTKKQTRRR